MNVRAATKKLEPLWHANAPVEGFGELDRIEARAGCALPADFKWFLQWFSNGGEGELPGGSLSLFPVEDLATPGRNVSSALGRLLPFGSDGGDDLFAFDLDRHAASATYPVVRFPANATDPDEVETVGEDFASFLESWLRPRVVGSGPMSRVLMQIVVDELAFLEMSGDDVVDPDAAVRQLEGIAALLQELPSAERRQFLGFVKEQADRAARDEDRLLVEFLRKLPEALGLRAGSRS